MAAPIAADLPSADQIARMGRIHNIKIEVAEHYYRQPHEAIKRLLIQEGTFGEIHFAYCRFIGHGYHAVSLLRSYIGFDIPPVRVSGFQNDFPIQPHTWPTGSAEPATIERWQHGVVEFKGGQRGIYDFTSLSYGSPLRWNRTKASTEIYGEKGMCIGLEPIFLNGSEAPQPIVIKRRTTEVNGVEVLDAYIAETQPQIVWENPFRQYPLTDQQIGVASCLMSIARAIREGEEPEYGLFNARTDREIDRALAWSWDRDGQPIELL
jgi:predicted dehydrogenase